MTTQAQDIDLPALPPSSGQGPQLLDAAKALPFLGSLKVQLTARLGTTEISVAELSSLKAGSTLALEQLVSQPVDLLVEGHVIAQGTLVAVDGHFGVRITAEPQPR
jgi:flagellar motor switch protein FliN/FliY